MSLDNIGDSIQKVLEGVVDEKYLPTAKYQLVDWIKKIGYANTNQTYWNYMRNLIQQIIYHNICKANKILYGQYEISEEKYKESFEKIVSMDLFGY